MNTIGYDTVRGYMLIGDQYWEIVHELRRRGMRPDTSRPSRDKAKFYYTMEVGKGILKIDFKAGILIAIQCSLPKILYGRNCYLSDTKEAKRAMDMITKCIGLDFKEFFLCRVDITAMLDLPYDYKCLRRVVRAPKHHKYLYDFPKGICFATGKLGNRKRDRVLAIYNKIKSASQFGNGVVRIEARLNTASKIKAQIKHDSYMRDLIKDSCFLACVSYLEKVTGEATRVHKRSEYAMAIMASLDDTILSSKI
ncbi:hypothetical protein [Pontibacter virosus]|nr:hypothetical protein [Pontibacter virosus]